MGCAVWCSLTGCVESVRLAAGPVHATAVVAPTRPVAAPVVMSEPVYIAAPQDQYVLSAADSDVVVLGGITYIYYQGIDGRRYRHEYGRGDLRSQIFRRREDLRVVMAHHGGHLPRSGTRELRAPPRRVGTSSHSVEKPNTHLALGGRENRAHEAQQSRGHQHGSPDQLRHRLDG